jgi:hypothetical protein
LPYRHPTWPQPAHSNRVSPSKRNSLGGPR